MPHHNMWRGVVLCGGRLEEERRRKREGGRETGAVAQSNREKTLNIWCLDKSTDGLYIQSFIHLNRRLL